jgi:hypothetical protein
MHWSASEMNKIESPARKIHFDNLENQFISALEREGLRGGGRMRLNAGC